MSTPSERHNQITNDAVFNLFGPIVRNGGKIEDVCTALESIIFGAGLIMIQAKRAKPEVAAGLMEAALQRAIERLAEDQNKR